MENIISVVRKSPSKKFSVIVITKYKNEIILSTESKELTYLELGTYLLSHDIDKIEIIEIIK